MIRSERDPLLYPSRVGFPGLMIVPVKRHPPTLAEPEL